MQFTSSLILLAACVASVFADVAQLKTDIANIDSKVTTLNNSLQKTSGTSYLQALQIDGQAKDTNTAVKTATTTANGLDSVSSSDAADIIASLTKTEVTVKAATDRLAALAPKFTQIGVAGIAKGDVADLQASVAAFGEAVISKAPADQIAAAQALIDQYNKDLATAAAAYA